MDMNTFFNDLQSKISQAIENSPAKDIEKNVKSMMTQGFSKLDLVTREEFDIQTQVLAKTRAKLEALETRLAALEAKAGGEAAKVDIAKGDGL
ncbi:accessory factor UbiK family protein [Duganella sp. FT50W]|uniref:Ubiquinone biosynthesis accessory factor UbiK n=1 Tax=Duganella lactea TaxID=2692173 RepID=A0A6L8MTH3_9BURK|nr:accessory factor UbiK family protein [Duganella lactea]MYM37601.1 accessory factor UbiK family protein [Duganella lactea]MYM85391.1 accessory factor UbiK family protein [Duganella lactea]